MLNRTAHHAGLAVFEARRQQRCLGSHEAPHRLFVRLSVPVVGNDDFPQVHFSTRQLYPLLMVLFSLGPSSSALGQKSGHGVKRYQ